jgi:hypothetical protein
LGYARWTDERTSGSRWKTARGTDRVFVVVVFSPAYRSFGFASALFVPPFDAVQKFVVIMFVLVVVFVVLATFKHRWFR